MEPGKRELGASSLRLSPMDAIDNDNLLQITELETAIVKRGKGEATKLLQAICAEADKDKTLLVLTPKPYRFGALTAQQLEAWYSKHGFASIQRKPVVLMCREPQ